MNPSLKVLLALIVSLELSFKVSLYTNLLVMALCLCWLLVKKMRPKAILTMLFFATLAAFTVFSSAYLFPTASSSGTPWTSPPGSTSTP